MLETSSEWIGITVKYRAILMAFDERTACFKIIEKIRTDENGHITKERYENELVNLPLEHLQHFSRVN